MRSLVLAATCAAFPTLSFAAPITLEFSGQIDQYFTVDNSSTPVDALGTLSSLDASGSLTWDLALGPAPVLTLFPGQVYDYTVKNPPTEFISGSVTWANGVFTSSPISVPVGMTPTQDEFAMANILGTPDLLVVADLFGWEDPNDLGNYGLNGIILNSWSSFLDDASGFWDEVTYPNVAGAQNVIAFANYSEVNGIGNGWAASILIDRITLRAPTAVPEPGTAFLLLAGLGGAALVRRKRSASKS